MTGDIACTIYHNLWYLNIMSQTNKLLLTVNKYHIPLGALKSITDVETKVTFKPYSSEVRYKRCKTSFPQEKLFWQILLVSNSVTCDTIHYTGVTVPSNHSMFTLNNGFKNQSNRCLCFHVKIQIIFKNVFKNGLINIHIWIAL